MAWTINSAFAPAFTWTTVGGAGHDVTVTIGGHGHDIVVPTTDARILLGHGSTAGTTEPLCDFLQYVGAVLSAGIVPHDTLTLELMPATGKVKIATGGGSNFAIDLSANPLGALLGFTTPTPLAPPDLNFYIADWYPKYLGLIVSAVGTEWSPRLDGVWQVDADGVPCGVRSTTGARAVQEVEIGFVPRDATTAVTVSSIATPLYPYPQYVATPGSHVVPWSWLDLLAVAGARTCGLTVGGFQSLATSPASTERYDLCAVDPEFLREPAFERVRRTWPTYLTFTLPLIRRASVPTSTRT